MPSTSTHKEPRGRSYNLPYLDTLPYDHLRVSLDCQHTLIYLMQNEPQQPPFCGLCFFREGWLSELPTRFHMHGTLAENGNPETSPKFFAHLFLAAGLVLPPEGESLHEFRRKRITPRGREQYTEAAWRLFPVASSLWKLMGYQPPLGIVLVRGVSGHSESAIARELAISLQNVHIRMAKAVRTAMGYIPRVEAERQHDGTRSGDSDRTRASQIGYREPGTAARES